MLPTYKIQMLNIFWSSCVNNALEALSLMIRKNVKLLKSSVNIELINNIPKLMSPEEVTTTLVYTTIAGQFKGVIITSSSLKGFLKLMDILLNKETNYYDALNEENKSSIIELGGIINGYFITSLNRLFNSKFDCERPMLSVNPYRAVEYFNFGNLYVEKINVLTFHSNFNVEDVNIQGKLILLLEESKTDMLLETISQNIKIV